MSLLGRGALGFARSRLGGVVAWVVLSPLRALSPFRHIAGDGTVTVLGHPRPSYPVHYLVVPRRRIKDFLGADLDVVQSAIGLATVLARRHPDGALELWTNLGRHQDVRLLHFHLIRRVDGSASMAADGELDLRAASLEAVRRRVAEVLERSGAARVVLRLPAGGGGGGAYEVLVRE